jgi:hypothetical protein
MSELSRKYLILGSIAQVLNKAPKTTLLVIFSSSVHAVLEGTDEHQRAILNEILAVLNASASKARAILDCDELPLTGGTSSSEQLLSTQAAAKSGRSNNNDSAEQDDEETWESYGLSDDQRSSGKGSGRRSEPGSASTAVSGAAAAKRSADFVFHCTQTVFTALDYITR